MNSASSQSNKQPLILIIDDDAEIRYSLHRVLSSNNYSVITASSGEEGIELGKKEKPQVVFLDNRMEGMGGLETLQHLREVTPDSMVILMTAFGTTQTAIEAMKFGAFDYIVKMFNAQKILELTSNAIKAHNDLATASDNYQPLLTNEDLKEGIIGNSDRMQAVFKTIGQVAASPVTVLITGESGTGKELVARCIHRHSHLAEQPFLAVNCAAIPENLIESELFGHERGSFTGANQQRIGVFEQCDGGSIFLDEIGDMALPTQTKILRAIQSGEIQRVGGTGVIKINVRLIAATNKDLETMVQQGDFREDLYYRLNVVRIKMPALRERESDTPLLVDFMVQRYSQDRSLKVAKVSAKAMDILRAYRWPGNVRELENVIQRACVICKSETITPKDLPAEILASVDADATVLLDENPAESNSEQNIESNDEVVVAVKEEQIPAIDNSASQQLSSMDMIGQVSLEDAFNLLFERLCEEKDENILGEIELAMIHRVLKETKGNQVKASTLLGITRSTLRKRIDQYNIRY